MSGFAAEDAGKRAFDASKAISAGLLAASLSTQEREHLMRRKRFQRGCLRPRKRNGKNYWYAQWREGGRPKSKELGLCSKMSPVEAEAKFMEILQPVNAGAERAKRIDFTFESFVEAVYL